VTQEFGWADFMVRSARAIRRHWEMVCCAFTFCWCISQCSEQSAEESLAQPAEKQNEQRANKESKENNAATQNKSWPAALRKVRGWLTPWTYLQRGWRGWSNAPVPKELAQLLRGVAAGQALNLYLRI